MAKAVLSLAGRAHHKWWGYAAKIQPQPSGWGIHQNQNNRGFSHDGGGTMSYVRVWIHSVWGTKSRKSFLTKEIRSQVIQHILTNAKEKQIYIDRLNGYTDHLHCLLGLNAEMSIAKTLQLIKGESSFWINKNKITPIRFEWADEYYAVSVCESDLRIVREYIDNQEEHHRKKSFEEEASGFLKWYGFAVQG
jgi:putative transposase